MKVLSHKIFLQKFEELEMNFTAIGDDKKEWYYKKLKFENETRFKIAIDNILESTTDHKYFPMLGEIKKRISQVILEYNPDEKGFKHCEKCNDCGYIFKKVLYPKLSGRTPYEVAFCCSCDWGKENAERDRYQIKEGLIKPKTMKHRAYRGKEDF